LFAEKKKKEETNLEPNLRRLVANPAAGLFAGVKKKKKKKKEREKRGREGKGPRRHPASSLAEHRHRGEKRKEKKKRKKKGTSRPIKYTRSAAFTSP